MKATRGHLPWQNVDARLRSMREIWIATTSPKGRPDAVPVWFWWDGEVAYLTCKAATTKPRNIAHEPNVALHNGDGTDPIIPQRTSRARHRRRRTRAGGPRLCREVRRPGLGDAGGDPRRGRPRVPRDAAADLGVVVRDGRYTHGLGAVIHVGRRAPHASSTRRLDRSRGLCTSGCPDVSER